MKSMILFLIVISCSVIAGENYLTERNAITEIVVEIAGMTGRDQAIRFELLRAQSLGYSLNEISKKTNILKLMDKIDSENIKRLKEIVKQYGWPGIKKFGALTDNNAFLIVQHATNDSVFQQEMLTLLDNARKSQDTIPAHYAYLYDRIQSNKNQKQRYATQGRCIGHHKWKPFPIETIEELDKRRKDVGLEPYSDYLKYVSNMCP